MSDSVTEQLLATRFGIWHIFLIALIYGLVTKKRKLLKDWIPFLFLWIVYDMMRGIADDFREINIKNVYDFEKLIFGWMFGGLNPSEWAQNNQYLPLTLFYSLIYAFHPFIPLIVAVLIYYKEKDIEMFKEYKYAFLLTVYIALVTFALFPVAPPWYVWDNGNGPNFNQPEVRTSKGSQANLIDFDNFFKTNVFGDFYTTFNANPYAAVPSLHGAFSYFATYYIIRKYAPVHGKKVYIAIIYPFFVWTAAVYLNHHYIVDLLAGLVYSYSSIRIVRYIREKRALKAKDGKKTEDEVAHDIADIQPEPNEKVEDKSLLMVDKIQSDE